MKKLFIIIILLTSTICYSQRSVHNRVIYKPVNLIEDTVIKKDTFETIQKVMISQDSVVHSQNRTILEKDIEIKDLLKKPAQGSSPMAWLNYLLGLFAIGIVWALSFIKKFEKSTSPLIQRWIGETSDFIKRIQKICLPVSVAIPAILGTGIFTGDIATILGTIEIITLSILGFSLFTTKSPELQGKNKVSEPKNDEQIFQ